MEIGGENKGARDNTEEKSELHKDREPRYLKYFYKNNQKEKF
jgi:hypothetical protein